MGTKDTKPFHYRILINNPKIKDDVKRKALMGLATKIENMNVYYSSVKIDKRNYEDNFYITEAQNIIKDYFLNLFSKILRKENLKLIINYDYGQKPVTNAIRQAIIEYKKIGHNQIELTSVKDENLSNHSFADFLVSMEKVKIKNELNILGKVESEFFKDKNFLNDIFAKIKKKNLDQISDEDFEKNIFKK